MADPNRKSDALLTEHFRYTPLSLIDEIINTVNTIIYRALEAIETGLFSIPPLTLGFGQAESGKPFSPGGDLAQGDDADANGNVAAKTEIENGVHQLETLLEASVDKKFDLFEIYTLRNILTVPDDLAGWIRLAHYENLNLPLPSISPTPESILHLRRKLAETKRLNRALRKTHTTNSALLSSLSSLLSAPPDSSNPSDNPTLSFLTNHPSAQSFSLPASSESVTPLTKTATFATSQLPALRKLVEELRPRIESLRRSGMGGGRRDGGKGNEGDAEGWREERRAYIEDRVRTVVKAGVELGGSRGEEEVLGLEGVVEGIQGVEG